MRNRLIVIAAAVLVFIVARIADVNRQTAAGLAIAAALLAQVIVTYISSPRRRTPPD